MAQLNNIELEPGTRVLAFDYKGWLRAGQKNTIKFWKPATIVQGHIENIKYISKPEHTVDLRFDHRPHDISFGHHIEYLKAMNADFRTNRK